MSDEKASDHAASSAPEVLTNGRTSDDSKSAAGSTLSQVNGGRSTGDAAAHAASETLQSDDTGKKSKTAAGSALS